MLAVDVHGMLVGFLRLASRVLGGLGTMVLAHHDLHLVSASSR